MRKLGGSYPLRVYLSGSERVVADLAVPHVVVRRQPHRRAVRLDEPPPLRRTLHAMRYKQQSSAITHLLSCCT
jgi:hypothetical protein